MLGFELSFASGAVSSTDWQFPTITRLVHGLNSNLVEYNTNLSVRFGAMKCVPATDETPINGVCLAIKINFQSAQSRFQFWFSD